MEIRGDARKTQNLQTLLSPPKVSTGEESPGNSPQIPQRRVVVRYNTSL
jgi:hypothetical protein